MAECNFICCAQKSHGNTRYVSLHMFMSALLNTLLICTFCLLQNNRHAKLITVGVRPEDSGYSSRSCPLRLLDIERINKDIYEVLLTFKNGKQDSHVW